MATVAKCPDCENNRYVNYTGLCKRCVKERSKKIWVKNKARGLIK